MRFNLEKAAELAMELGLEDEAERWNKLLAEFPELAIDEHSGFMFAPGLPYNESHRHFSHLMGFHPLGLVDYAKGEKDKLTIDNTLRNLEKQGSDFWTGYSFSWQANLYARVFDGDNAAKALRTFANCFCLKNSFHANGDQCRAGHSKFTYRPFTLEGNFAFASAIQEMLLQSHSGVLKVFPAVPQNWQDISFNNLRSYGAFLVSAKKENGQVERISIVAEKGGVVKLENPFAESSFVAEGGAYTLENGIIVMELVEGQQLTLFSN
jgi:alpha-L-fucosidase 2